MRALRGLGALRVEFGSDCAGMEFFVGFPKAREVFLYLLALLIRDDTTQYLEFIFELLLVFLQIKGFR